MLAFDLAREAPGAGASASGMVNLGGFSAAIVAQGAIAMLIGAQTGCNGMQFPGDAALAALVQPALIVLAIAQPVCGVVFVLDGVLMGANDARYLAIAGGLNLVVYLPALIALWLWHPGGTAGLTWLAAAFFGVFMLARLFTLGWRIRRPEWMLQPA